MGWLQLLFLIIRIAPEFIALIKALLGRNNAEFSREDFDAVKAGAVVCHQTGDSGPLREALERLRDRHVKP